MLFLILFILFSSIYISSNETILVLSILVLWEVVAPTIDLIKNKHEFYSFQYILFFSIHFIQHIFNNFLTNEFKVISKSTNNFMTFVRACVSDSCVRGSCVRA